MFFMKSLKILLFALLGLALLPAAQAATFQVTKTVDEVGACDPGDCALREAVLAANASPEADIIEVPAGVYLLTIPGAGELFAMQGDLNLIGDLEIHGAPGGQTVIQSAVADRVLSARAPQASPSTIRLSDLVITGGESDTGAGFFGSRIFLTIERTTIWGNIAAFIGGGIQLEVSDLTLTDSTVSANSVPQGFGAGISILCPINSPCQTVIRNSTISENSSAFSGGAILNNGATLTVVDSTIVGNTASSGTVLYTDIQSPAVQFQRSLVSGDCVWLNVFSSGSAGGNLESPGNTCRLDQVSDQVSVADPGIGPLANNGGPTFTHALLPGSPAIDTAGGGCGPLDQRGFSRPQDGDADGSSLCDAGAFEAPANGVGVAVPSLGLVGISLLVLLLALMGISAIRRY